MVMTRAQRLEEKRLLMLESSKKPEPIANKTPDQITNKIPNLITNKKPDIDSIIQENERLRRSEANANKTAAQYQHEAYRHLITIQKLKREKRDSYDDVAIMKLRAQEDAIKSRKFPASEMVAWSYTKNNDLIATKQEVLNYMKTIKRLTEENESLHNGSAYQNSKKSDTDTEPVRPKYMRKHSFGT